MSWPYGLNIVSFIFLVPRVPTPSELQAALDAQDFLGRLTLDKADPVQVQSDTPPLYQWRGQLDGKDVSFRIGVTEPAKLPGEARTEPGIRAWPVALWSTNAGQPDVVGAGAMALHAWAVATHGAAYSYSRGVVYDLSGSKQSINYILTCNSLRWDRLSARYPDFLPEVPVQRGVQGTIEIRIR